MKRNQESTETRFWRHVTKSDGCWLWTGCKVMAGYGEYRTASYGRMLAHRMSWTLTYGEIPQGTCVLHHCDTPACVRPDHLFLGTQADNNHDMIRKGRHRPGHGERHALAKLTDEKVLAIRRRYAEGDVSMDELGAEYDVDASVISRAVTGRTWKHLQIVVSEEAQPKKHVLKDAKCWTCGRDLDNTVLGRQRAFNCEKCADATRERRNRRRRHYRALQRATDAMEASL